MKKQQGIPRLLQVYWNSENSSFTCSVSELFSERIKSLTKDGVRLYEFYKDKFGEFQLDQDDSFGFGGVMEKVVQCGGDASYRCELLTLKVASQNKCHFCKGKGKNPYSGDICYLCAGQKVEFVDDVNASKIFSNFGATVSYLSRILHYTAMDWSPSSDSGVDFEDISLIEQQTMMFGMPFDGKSMDAWLHKEVADMVRKFDDSERERVGKAMASVDGSVFPLHKTRSSHSFDYRLMQNDSSFWLMVPGSACTLGTEGDFGNLWRWGVQLSPHNIDHRFSQLYFLAGLAEIDAIFREKISVIEKA